MSKGGSSSAYQVVSIGLAETLWVGTSRWELGLARSGGGVEVQARGTGSEALDTVVAGEVCNTCVVYEVVTVASLSTIGI